MSKSLIAAALIAAALSSAGCASYAPNDYSYGEARAVQNVSYGTVESVRPVRINADPAPGGGTLAGAAIGGLLGNFIGHGYGRGLTTVLGAVGGGVAGNAIERDTSAANGEEIVVRMDHGGSIAVVQGTAEGFAPGARVRVLMGPRGARIEHA
jgi:outer membrane lipoprotein SlyB